MDLQERVSQLSPLKQAFLKINELQAKLHELEHTQQDPPHQDPPHQESIAIVGMGCRFPGDADTPAAYWTLLREGVSAVGAPPAQRWGIERNGTFAQGASARLHEQRGHFLKNVGHFDSHFFGISSREAQAMDPQQQLLLEVTIEALENAFIPPGSLLGTQTGVYMGLMNIDYQHLGQSDLETLDIYGGSGSGISFPAGRLSYALGLRGPSMIVASACSSSLVTTHLACQALRTGECDLALSGGVSLLLAPHSSALLAKMEAISPDGLSKTFDAAADGYGRGEGCGVVVLKRLSDAQRDGDTIHALIRGSAINHNGRSGGLIIPSRLAQEELLTRALASAHVTADEVSYIEAHGTGTALGDPIEVGALRTVYCPPDRQSPLIVGSAKTNIGHLEPAAGIAGLIKVVLSMKNRQIPPHLHFKTPNPHIDWAELPIQIPTSLTAWESEKPRIAGISSFGLSGMNGHVIVEEAPVSTAEPPTIGANMAESSLEDNATRVNPIQTTEETKPDRPYHLLMLSAKSPDALLDLANRYVEYLTNCNVAAFSDLCYSAATGRSHYEHCLSIVAEDALHARQQLTAYVDGNPTAHTAQGTATGSPSKIAFLFTGQGSQYVGMGRELYETDPTFRATMDECDAILQDHLDESLLEVIYDLQSTIYEKNTVDRLIVNRKTEIINQTAYTQPALFAVEYALATLWQSWGLRPNIAMGHSIGELVAACVAGVFSLNDGLTLAAARGRLMQALPQNGAMVSLRASESRVASVVATYQSHLSIAAVNSPEQVVISGERTSIETIVAQLEADGIKAHPLTVSHAFHSPLMEPMLDDFRAIANRLTYHKPTIDFVSNRNGQLVTDEVTDPEYWVRHVRDTVRFADGVTTLMENGTELFLEIGPKPTLLAMIREGTDKGQQQSDVSYFPSLRQGRSDWQQMLTSLGALYTRGIRIDWDGVEAGRPRRKVTLPNYPFQRQQYWQTPSLRTAKHNRKSDTQARSLVDRVIKLPLQKQTLFETAFSLDALPFLADHRVMEMAISPGACHLAMMFQSADLLFGGEIHQLKDILFSAPLVIPTEDERIVQLVAMTEKNASRSNGRTKLQLISFDPDQEEETPSTHAVAEVTLLREGVRQNTESRSYDNLSQIEQRCTMPIEVDEFYRIATTQQIHFGPTFRWLEEVRQSSDGCETLAQLQLPEGVHITTGDLIHPGLIDACFQVASMTRQDAAPTDLELPFAVGSIKLWAQATGVRWWCHARQTETRQWEIELFDEHGQLLLEINNFEMQTVPPEALQALTSMPEWLYQLEWHPKALVDKEDMLPREGNEPTHWLIVGGTAEFQEAFALQNPTSLFIDVGISAEHPQIGAEWPQSVTIDLAEPEPLQQLLQTIDESSGSDEPRRYGVVYFGGMITGGMNKYNKNQSIPEQAEEMCTGLLHLTQALIKLGVDAQLWVVTQNAVATDQIDENVAVAQAPLWGMGRTIALEHPQLRCTCVDLDQIDHHLFSLLAAEFAVADQEAQVVYRRGIRHAARLARWQPPAVLQNPGQPMRASLSDFGTIDSLQLVAMPRRMPAAGEVEIQVEAAGLNLRDLLNALGMLKEYYAEVLGIERAEDVPLGFECAGTIAAVGKGVTNFAVGDPVMALVTGSCASFVTLREGLVAPIPNALNMAEAATIPLAYLTAYYGLHTLAQIQPGDRVLIHAAAGGVGQAAVQLAQAAGAEIYATASPTKWAFLQAQGITRISNSRTLDFANEIFEWTDDQGVDIVLNSLNGEMIDQSFAVLGVGGRFVELGKLGIWTQAQAEERRPDVRYLPFDLGEVIANQPQLLAELWQALAERFNNGVLTPLPVTRFPASRLADAFRFMQQSKHVGKIVLDFPTQQPLEIKADGAYLITGGLGALGLQMARQLVDSGARTLILSGRRDIQNDDIRKKVDALQEMGASIHVVQADVANIDDVQQLLDSCQTFAPLRGIVHAAGLLDDGLLTEQSRVRFKGVMSPKVWGTWHLHTVTQELPHRETLDFFFCFSSMASLLGSPGQVNYAAANAFMDALMAERHQLSTSSMSINWGPWAEAGMAAAQQEQMHAQGLQMITPTQGRAIFASIFSQQSAQRTAQLGVFPIQWSRFANNVTPAQVSTFFSALMTPSLIGSAGSSSRSEPSALQRQLAGRSDRERQQILVTYLQNEFIQVMGLPQPPEPQRGFTEMGIDSLMAVELRNRLQTECAISLPATVLFNYPTIEDLAAYLSQQLSDKLSSDDIAEEATVGIINESSNGQATVLPDISTDGQLDTQLETTHPEAQEEPDLDQLAQQLANQLSMDWSTTNE